jgi:GT2 family glycosyltransferase
MNNGIDVTIIIVSYNTMRLLEACLHSIYNNISELNFEVIVVDNNSRDGSQEMVKKNFSDVKLIQNKENLGFSKANNQGIRIAKGDYLLLLNPDTAIMPEALDSMVEFMKKNQKVGAIGPKLIDINGVVQPSAGREDTIYTVLLRYCTPRSFNVKIKRILAKNHFRKFRKLLGSQVDSYLLRSEIETPTEIDRISGASFLVRRKTIKEVGLLDEKIFLYSEDADLCFRIKKKGWKIVYFPEAKIIHYGGGASGGDFKPVPFCYGVESAHYYFKKHYNKTTSFTVRCALLAALIARAPWFLYHHLVLKKQNINAGLWTIYHTVLTKIITDKIGE